MEVKLIVLPPLINSLLGLQPEAHAPSPLVSITNKLMTDTVYRDEASIGAFKPISGAFNTTIINSSPEYLQVPNGQIGLGGSTPYEEMESLFKDAQSSRPEETIKRQRIGMGARNKKISDYTFAALIVTRPQGLPRVRQCDYQTYALNPTMLHEWLGPHPLPRLLSSLEPDFCKPSLAKASKQINGVFGITINNLYGRTVVEREKLGSTVMTWSDYRSGNEFSILSSTWE